MISISQKNKNKLKGMKFIDLFSGIGGFHLSLNSFETECVFSSEWDKHASKVYENNFKIKPFGDITKINESEIPSHDILTGGFPCQAFSISGKQKGFEDSRGTLFFDIVRIVKYHNPKILLLENVYNLEKHDGGNTLSVILGTLDELGYNTFHKVLNASHYGIPQIRKRIFFVCFRKDLLVTDFKFPKPTITNTRLIDFLEKDLKDENIFIKPEKLKSLKITKEKSFQKQLNFSVKEFNTSIRIGSVNKGGQGERIYSPEGTAITLSAYGGGIGSKTGLYKIDNKIRKLTPRECANITGFPEDFILDENKNQSYKQFGNSVVVDVVQNILIQINNYL
jgi:DNA (cytosine-5)-methyltransferase 1